MLPSIERKIRAGFPLIRFMQASVPAWLSRWPLQQAVKRARLGANVTRQAVSADGTPCEWIIPSGSPRDRVLLYLHGGGFVFGMTPQHLEMAAYLARQMDARALLVDYRLAPAHPFPAPLDDCLTAYGWLLKQGIPASRIVIAGDSAGGNLTLTTLMKLRDSGAPLPAAAACLSPVTDLSNKDNPPEGAGDPMLPHRAVRMYNTSYIARDNPRNPLISPVFGDWRGLPPLLVHVGEDEILRDDSVRVETLAKAAGVDARLEIYPRMWHVWQLFPQLPQARQSLDDIAQFLGGKIRG